MGGQFGVTNFLKCADVLIEGGNIVGLALEDGKLSLGDVSLVFRLIDELKGLIGVNWKEIPKEVTELDAEDLAKIKAHFVEKFDIPQDNIEEVIEKISGIIISAAEVGLNIYKLVKEIKK